MYIFEFFRIPAYVAFWLIMIQWRRFPLGYSHSLHSSRSPPPTTLRLRYSSTLAVFYDSCGVSPCNSLAASRKPKPSSVYAKFSGVASSSSSDQMRSKYLARSTSLECSSEVAMWSSWRWERNVHVTQELD